jgi:hypothetical protein
MANDDSIYHEAAVRLIEKLGCAGAYAEAKRCRDQNTLGTVSFAFHNAVTKEILKLWGANES